MTNIPANPRRSRKRDREITVIDLCESPPPKRRFDMIVKFGHHSHVKTSSGEELPLLRELGEGVYGKVFLTKRHNQRFALKLLKNHLEHNQSTFKHEKSISLLVGDNPHSNLVRTVDAGTLYTVPELCAPYFFVMELLGYSLFDVMRLAKQQSSRNAQFRANPVFRNEDIAKIGKQVLRGALKLEQLGIVHLDLKPENIFCSADTDVDFNFTASSPNSRTPFIKMNRILVKIGDFGCARYYDPEQPPKGGELVQTQNYRAPEIFLGLPFSFKSDVWSIGCILAELYIGDLLFYGNTDEDTEAVQFAMMKRVIGQGPTPRMWRQAMEIGTKTKYDEQGDAVMIATTSRCLLTWQLASNKRPDDPEVQLFELLDRLFRIDPHNRPSFHQAIQHRFFLGL